MAFNFNWSPLMADTSRAREMLTAALNKSPKPPIIVDDIVVTELNLGETPPDLEILEIGDLAEDRFRGIFKMTYAGDAFLTLKTRVQANPLNTYLSTKPSFASPEPLAAASGLTIPLQITLSEFRLSGFVILVFSKQKGITIVFRNDPVESLKVSSTFDSIPFVRDYLQREIEKQLRNLFMEDLPAILHRLSLRLWSPEYSELHDQAAAKPKDDAIPVDPLASPPLDPVDWFGTSLEEQMPEFSLDSSSERHATFSQKNMVRLASLAEANNTLSLFTPTIRDAVYRAWAAKNDRNHNSGTQTPAHLYSLPSLSRMNSSLSSVSSRSVADSDSNARSTPSTSYSFHNAPRSRTHNRKRKNRVINLRKPKEGDASGAQSGSVSDTETATTTPEPSVFPSAGSVTSEPVQSTERAVTSVVEPTVEGSSHREAAPEPATPRSSAKAPVLRSPQPLATVDTTRAPSQPPPAYTPSSHQIFSPLSTSSLPYREKLSRSSTSPGSPTRPTRSPSTSAIPLLRNLSSAEKGGFSSGPAGGEAVGGILEQAWMMKIAREVARKMKEEQARDPTFSGGVLAAPAAVVAEEETLGAPPAYVV
ncbi:hypothetical protein EJ06DRAFT_532466 [Trichodelitschia bisporula]|uniref:Mitochondrial distribution and morphology protein 34 n=1 Tax=Trichodelitschia bisporula TaxID=703511 RepID=A0A6G1HQC3_9PEZI|nr:hypothetical protein EJ06DRAFT_532466 [Trichodelitschia bisporula]